MSHTLSFDDVLLLREIAAHLDAHVGGKPLSADQAAAFRDSLKRMATAQVSDAEELEMCVAGAYLIRKELAGPGKWKEVRAAVAKECGVTDQTVSTYSTRLRSVTARAIEMQISTRSEYAGLTRPQALMGLLDAYKIWLSESVKRKSFNE